MKSIGTYQTLNYIKTSNQFIDNDKMEKIVVGLSENINSFINLFDEFFMSDNITELFYKDKEYDFHVFNISDCQPNEQKLLINVFSRLKPIKVNSLEKIVDVWGDINIYDYNNKFYIAGNYSNIYIRDFQMILREKKLKRVLKKC